ncbi:hypothetical protein T4D_2544 [Trichinella pseudospiralis]|uniref:Uncharacterized protein n=1 Tax=Trichinella pseudospiralis TaxID=6337 RepID=A0A0V1F4W2_TRIPS|nr:hypothetical protein T4D_2544 [Trichinella pseudospiralis]
MVECMNIYSTAVCMLANADHFYGTKISVQAIPVFQGVASCTVYKFLLIPLSIYKLNFISPLVSTLKYEALNKTDDWRNNSFATFSFHL